MDREPSVRPWLIVRIEELAVLETGNALGEPAPCGQSAKIGGIERGIPFGKIDDAHPVIAGNPPDRPQEIANIHSAWTGARCAGHLRAVDHVDVTVENYRVRMRHMLHRLLDRFFDGTPADLLGAHDEVASLERIAVHLCRVGEASEADLGNVLAGKSVLHQRSNRVAVAEAVLKLAHVEMRVEGDKSNFVERNPERKNRWTGDGVVSAGKKGKRMILETCFDRLADRSGRLLDVQAAKFDVAAIVDRSEQRIARLDIVAADPLQYLPEKCRCPVACAPRHRAGCKRRADEANRHFGVVDK